MDHHERKFDRQIRLWGVDGQRRLEMAHVLVIGGGPCASETLKNLILANLAQFSLVDDTIITTEHIGNDFFVPPGTEGKVRSVVVVEQLKQLNESTKGTAIATAPSVFINETDDFALYDVVICCNLAYPLVITLSATLFPLNKPLIRVTSRGFLSILRSCYREHAVIESHPENMRDDLWVHPEQLEKFPELKQFVLSFDLNTGDDSEHAHIPFIAVLGQLILRWREEKGIPSTFKERQQFKSYVMENARDFGQEVNFQEACQFAHLACTNPWARVDCTVKSVLEEAGDVKDCDFWVLAWALCRFVEEEGFLPVVDKLPDMTTFPHYYIQLRDLFKKREQCDIDRIRKHCEHRCKSLGRGDPLTDSQIELFVRNCRNLRVERTSCIESEYQSDLSVLQENFEACEQGKVSASQWYIGFRAVEVFEEANGRCVGIEDVSKVLSIGIALAESKRVEIGMVSVQIIEELCRYADSEVHCVSAFAGGLAAQVVLKLLTCQYIPFNNTVVFDGVHCVAETLRL